MHYIVRKLLDTFLGMTDTEFKGKVALITGASSGIGAATAIHFAKFGANVAITGRNKEKLDQISEQCSAAGAEVFSFCCDLNEEKNVKELLDATIRRFGQLDILVNSAGIIVKGPIETATLSDFDTTLNINLRVPFYLMSLAVPHLIKTKGNVVNVSSVNGMRSFQNTVCYNVSKSALDQLTRCAAIDLASKQVRVNSVNPGVIKTEIHRRGGMSEDQYQKFLEHSKTTHALGRVGEVDEVAQAIAFLASDRASFITGAQLPIDGGRHALCPR